MPTEVRDEANILGRLRCPECKTRVGFGQIGHKEIFPCPRCHIKLRLPDVHEHWTWPAGAILAALFCYIRGPRNVWLIVPGWIVVTFCCYFLLRVLLIFLYPKLERATPILCPECHAEQEDVNFKSFPCLQCGVLLHAIDEWHDRRWWISMALAFVFLYVMQINPWIGLLLYFPLAFVINMLLLALSRAGKIERQLPPRSLGLKN